MALFGNRKEPEQNVADDANDAADENEDQQEGQAQPAYVTVDQMQAMIEAQGKQMQETLATLLAPATAPATMPEPEFEAEVSDDEMFAALEEGDNKKILQLQQRQRKRDRQIAEHQMNQLRQEGSQWIGNVNLKLAEEKFPDYGKYKKEIDGVLATFPANLRADDGIIEFVYNSVRGKHMDEELETRKKQWEEAQKRQANLEPTGDPSPGTRRQGQRYEEDEPYFSSDVDEALRFAGRSRDEQARRLGYTNWAEYEAMAREYDEKPMHRWTTGGNR